MSAPHGKADNEPLTTAGEAQMLLQLQDILLRKDREGLAQVQQVLEDKKLLAERVSPIVEEHLDFMKQTFPQEYQRHVEKVVEEKLFASQDDIVNIIYPKLGKMIQKYIAHQFEQLKESIDAQIAATLNAGPLGWVRRKVFGIKVSEEILTGMYNPVIEQIFVIQRDSGLLLGSAAKNEKIHEDLVAGMLTAIKAFAEDAFERGAADLEMIQYDNYRIFLQNFPRYYIAVVLGGSMTATQKKELSDNLLEFADVELKTNPKEIDHTVNLKIKEKLEQYFFTETEGVKIT